MLSIIIIVCLTAQVNSNGLLSFKHSFTACCPQAFPLSSPPLVAPFWHDFNPGVGGNIYYRQTNDLQLLQFYHIRLSTALATKDLDNFFPALLFIATWDQVAQYSGSAQVNSTVTVNLIISYGNCYWITPILRFITSIHYNRLNLVAMD